MPPPIPQLAKRIVVPPLSDERLTRIERAIVSRAGEAAPQMFAVTDAPRRWLGLALAIGATAAAAGVVGWVAHGRAATRSHGSELALAAPFSMHTEAQASTLDIGDATITSGPATAFVVTRPEGGVLVDMSRGRIELDVGKRGARPPLVVHAGDTEVIVIGTHFTVDFDDGQGEVGVRVREGRVRIVRQQHELFVSAGERWTSKGDAMVAFADTGDNAGIGVGLGGSDATNPVGATIGDVPATGSNGKVNIKIGPDPKVLHDRVGAIPDAHKPTIVVHKVGDGSGDAVTATRVPAGSADSDTVVGKNGELMTKGAATWQEQNANPVHAVVTAVKAVPLAPRLELDDGKGQKILGSANLIIGYKGLVFPQPGDSSKVTYGADASRAMYSLAQVQMFMRSDDALQTIDAYVRRFGHGPDLGDVLWLRVRILCSMRGESSISPSCRAAAQAYLDKAPSGAGSHAAELILATE